MIIEQANSQDLRGLEELIETTFVETWTGLVHDDDLRRHLADGHSKQIIDRFCRSTNADVLVVRSENELVGYAIGHLSGTGQFPTYYTLEKLYLRKSVQQCGIGHKLWNKIIEIAMVRGAEGLCLTHYPLNMRASRFYDRVGMKKVAETIYQCGNGEYRDWVLAGSWLELNMASSVRGVMAE